MELGGGGETINATAEEGHATSHTYNRSALLLALPAPHNRMRKNGTPRQGRKIRPNHKQTANSKHPAQKAKGRKKEKVTPTPRVIPPTQNSSASPPTRGWGPPLVPPHHHIADTTPQPRTQTPHARPPPSPADRGRASRLRLHRRGGRYGRWCRPRPCRRRHRRCRRRGSQGWWGGAGRGGRARRIGGRGFGGGGGGWKARRKWRRRRRGGRWGAG